MVSIFSLWLPIILSAVFVFIVSSIIHMVFKYHSNDFDKVPSEDEVMDDLRKYDIPPGDYTIPNAGSAEAMKSEAFIEKSTKGPVAFLTVIKSGPPSLGGSLVQWFLYSVLIGFFTAYVTSRAVGAETYYMEVFRFAGTVAFGAYAFGLMQNSIWYKRKWSATLKSMFDGFVCALVTAGVFGWLWPGI